MGLGVAANVAIGSAVLGAGTSLLGSKQAAGAASDAAALQQQQYQTTRGDLQPYFQPGYNALSGAFNLATGGPTGGGPDYVGMAQNALPGTMTQAQLEATPGYQFTRDQGLKAVQSAAAARGLGVSGASLKGAADYATGLASKTYLDQFNVAQQRFADYGSLNTAQQGNITNQYNRLADIAKLGESAAAQVGTQGTALANAAGTNIAQAGLDTAAGTTGVSNALTGSANNLLAYNNMQALIDRLPSQSGAQTMGYASDIAPGTVMPGGFVAR